MINVTTPYLELTPNFENKFRSISSVVIKETLNNCFDSWDGFLAKYPGYGLSLYIVKKRGMFELLVKGPTISKKNKVLDYSIFLPDEIKDLNLYIDLVFEGVGVVLSKYKVSEGVIEKMKEECKKELGL